MSRTTQTLNFAIKRINLSKEERIVLSRQTWDFMALEIGCGVSEIFLLLLIIIIAKARAMADGT